MPHTISTYRLQLNSAFTFYDAEKIAPYLHALGISDLYISPILQAQSKSTHCYDVINHDAINPDLGGEAGFKHLTKTLRELGLHLIVDIVPNHMAATSQNSAWMEVLKKRHSAKSAPMFDINWNASSKDHLVYRRFFDINELVSLHTEDYAVFEKSHQLLFQLIQEGHIQGLRVDHIDGLRDPYTYLTKLSQQTSPPLYIIVEKILAFNETLPSSWPVSGTTGYDFMNEVNQLFLNAPGLKALISHYKQCTGELRDMNRIRMDSAKQIIDASFKTEFNHLVIGLHNLMDGKPNDIEGLLLQISVRIAHYRFYVHQGVMDKESTKIIDEILDTIRPSDTKLLNQLTRILTLRFQPSMTTAQRKAWQQWHNDWEVFTGPLLAKSFEDTACYNYYPLISLNDVGSGSAYFQPNNPCRRFHAYNQMKQEQWPFSMNTTSTHDVKRSEDVRARLNVLTQCATEWNGKLSTWILHNKPKKTMLNGALSPDIVDEMLIYQTLLGAWPLIAKDALIFKTRLHDFLTKAVRERKVMSSWAAPNIAYEIATKNFVTALLDDPNFMAQFLPFQTKIAYFGMYNAQAQLVLKMTSPGVPDLYQGQESWRFDLVDPDNRQHINFAELHALESKEPLDELLTHWQDGRIKYNVTKALLQLRQTYQPIFLLGDYIPLQIAGKHARHFIAFAKKHNQTWMLVIVTIDAFRLINSDTTWSSARISDEDNVLLPIPLHSWHSILTHESITCIKQALPIKKLLSKLPFNIIMSTEYKSRRSD